MAAVDEQMHQRAGQKQQAGKGAQRVGCVLKQQIDHPNKQKAIESQAKASPGRQVRE